MQAEIGPIRPPSESRSLLIRLSRNCSWNKCLFCPVYKNEKFSIRKFGELEKEINRLDNIKNKILDILENTNISSVSYDLKKYFDDNEIEDAKRLLHWIFHNEFTVFLQDADPLFRKKDETIRLISLIKKQFPEIKRITAYARATTLTRFSIKDLEELKKSGLDRIHTGLESGSDDLLELVKKGIKKDDIIKSGLLLNEAKIEFSVYVIPGLGGKKLTKEHTTETADAINKSKPNFVRFRTLGLNEQIPYYDLIKNKQIDILSEEEMVLEIREIIEKIEIHTNIYSDHSLNLLMEINGKLPERKVSLLKKIDKFLNLDSQLKTKFIIARRLNELFELNEFLSFEPSSNVESLYNKIKDFSNEQKNAFFLELRSQTL